MAVDGRERGRHLARSTLHSEDIFVGGHTAVWGSYFDAEARRWGYACCRGTVRHDTCPKNKNGAAASLPTATGTALIDAESEGDTGEWAATRLLDPDAAGVEPPKPSPRTEATSDEEYLLCFVLHWFHAWAKSAAVRADAKVMEQSRKAFVPLVQQLRRKQLPRELLGSLVAFAEFASDGEYARANDVYVGITIGKALWHSKLDLGEQRAHWNGGGGLRTMQKQVVEKDLKNATFFDTDPEVQRYVHALKRLVTFMQMEQPALDPSKFGHVPPAVDPSDVSLPVMRGIRDSDGRQREPEFVEPLEASTIANDRGIPFGQWADRSHPFHGIGSARGV